MRSSALLALLFASGCGDALVRGEVADLRRRLDESQRQSAGASKKMEELEDRVFLLTDQVESQKVASSRATGTATAAPALRLPVVTLRPTDEPAPAGGDGGDEVEYRGEARSASPDKTRIYRLDGSRKLPPSATASSTVIPASLTPCAERRGGCDDNLGVAPAPDVAQVTRGAPEPHHALAGAVDGTRDPAPLVDPLKLYRAAYDELRAGRHDEAARRFRDFIRRFPRHDYADNAQYWLGECFYDRKQFAEAAVEFRQVVAQYPLGNKAPDALLKLAYCLLATGDLHHGRDLLSQLPQTYPRTEAARLAAERLAELGHLEGTK